MTTLVQEGDEQIKTFEELNSFFGPRISSLNIVSIGFGHGGIEQYFTERTGSTVHIFDCREKEFEKASEFGKLSTRIKLEKTIPCSINGTIRVKEVAYELQCSIYEHPQIDILKLDMKELTEFILYQILHAGYRPGLLYIRWDRHPDKYSDAMICAGHLQQVGYGLLSNTGPWFVYRFLDDCAYEYCSWARTDSANPLFSSFEEVVRTSLLTSGKLPAKSLPKQ